MKMGFFLKSLVLVGLLFFEFKGLCFAKSEKEAKNEVGNKKVARKHELRGKSSKKDENNIENSEDLLEREEDVEDAEDDF